MPYAEANDQNQTKMHVPSHKQIKTFREHIVVACASKIHFGLLRPQWGPCHNAFIMIDEGNNLTENYNGSCLGQYRKGILWLFKPLFLVRFFVKQRTLNKRLPFSDLVSKVFPPLIIEPFSFPMHLLYKPTFEVYFALQFDLYVFIF